MPQNAPSATTREAIRNVGKEVQASPGVAVSWKTTNVEVAKAGEAIAHVPQELVMGLRDDLLPFTPLR